METITNDIMEFDVYKSSKGYVKSNANKYSCRSGNYWKPPVQDEPLAFKAFNIKNDSRLKVSKAMSISKAMSNSYIAYKEIIIRENEISSFKKIELKLKENIFFIYKELKEIAEEIEFSEELLDYDENFDYEKTLPVTKELYFIAINFLINYSEFIFKNLGIIIQAPEINAGRNGNIYLAWKTNNARLAISIENNNNSEVIANYYGDLGSDREPIKGNVTVSKISEYLAYWMKCLA